MIPYVQIPPIPLGFMELHAFGLLSALGILLGIRLAAHAAKRFAPDQLHLLLDATPWAVLGGVVGGHLLHVLGYHPELLSKEGPVVLLRVWDGLSSIGGVLGGLAALAVYFRVKGRPLLPALDLLALGAAPGWALARLGCFVAHDHPGKLSTFPLAVAYPGGARHDLGLYDALVLATLAIVLWALARRPRPTGLFLGVLALGYAIPRFFLDYLRAEDLPFVDGRILGLTPAQWIMPAFAAIGVFLVSRALREGVRRPVPA